MIFNVMEKVVEMKLETYLPNSGCCECEECIDDIKCLVLNTIPAKYVNSHKGELFSRMEQTMLRQNSVDLDFAVLNAIDKIKENPRCGGNPKPKK